MVKIIGISGKAGVGKDYITRNILVPLLTNGSQYIIISFADHFKMEAIVKEKLDRDKVYGRKDKYTRSRLILLGTNEGRNICGNNIWVDILNEKIIQYESRGIEYVFISDCRFINEIEYVKSKGGVVIQIVANDRNLKAIQAEGCLEMVNHISENCEYKNWDYVLDNSLQNSKYLFSSAVEICKSIQNIFRPKTLTFYDFDFMSKEEIKNVVISSDPVCLTVQSRQNSDHLGKLYLCGLSAMKIEYVPNKNSSTFIELMNKYPSEIYFIFSLDKKVIQSAGQVGIKPIDVSYHSIKM